MLATPQKSNFGEIMGKILIVTKDFTFNFQKVVLSFIFPFIRKKLNMACAYF